MLCTGVCCWGSQVPLALVWAAWWWFSAPSGWLLPSVGVAAGLIWGWMAWRSWREPVVGRLHWDAQAPGLVDGETGGWWWHAGPDPQGTPLKSVEVAFDGQTVAWLRLHGPSDVPAWVCVQRQSDPARWHDLRRAWVQALR